MRYTCVHVGPKPRQRMTSCNFYSTRRVSGTRAAMFPLLSSSNQNGSARSEQYVFSMPVHDDQRYHAPLWLYHYAIGKRLCRSGKPNSSNTSLFTHGEHHLMEAERPLSSRSDAIRYMLLSVAVVVERQQSEFDSTSCYRDIYISITSNFHLTPGQWRQHY